jgi:hypothetical protein
MRTACLILLASVLAACAGATEIEPQLIPQAVADGVDLSNPAQVAAWIAKHDANQLAKQADASKRASLRKFKAAWLALGQTWPPQKADVEKVRVQIRAAVKAQHDSAAANIAASKWKEALQDVIAGQVLLTNSVDLLSAWVELGALVYTPDVPVD